MAVPSCAGAYVSGAAGSNECPAGSARIEAEAACRTAVAAAGKRLFEATFMQTDSRFPRGCYYATTTSTAWFNKVAVGAGGSNLALLCAALATGAPLTRRCANARVRTGGVSNSTNGLNIDTRACIRMYVYTRMHTYGSGGARRRCRAARGSAGGRRTGAQGRGTQGYSNMGTHGVPPAYCALYGQCASVGVCSTRFGCGRAAAAQRTAAVRGRGRGTTSQGDRWVLTGYSHAYSYAQGTHVRAHMGMGTHMRTNVRTHTCRGGALARLLRCRARSVALGRKGH